MGERFQNGLDLISYRDWCQTLGFTTFRYRTRTKHFNKCPIFSGQLQAWVVWYTPKSWECDVNLVSNSIWNWFWNIFHQHPDDDGVFKFLFWSLTQWRWMKVKAWVPSMAQVLPFGLIAKLEWKLWNAFHKTGKVKGTAFTQQYIKHLCNSTNTRSMGAQFKGSVKIHIPQQGGPSISRQSTGEGHCRLF